MSGVSEETWLLNLVQYQPRYQLFNIVSGLSRGSHYTPKTTPFYPQIKTSQIKIGLNQIKISQIQIEKCQK